MWIKLIQAFMMTSQSIKDISSIPSFLHWGIILEIHVKKYTENI